MRMFGYTFGNPLKNLILLFRESFSAENDLKNIHISMKKPSPQQKQYDEVFVVSPSGFSQLESQALREYGFQIIYTSVKDDFEVFQEKCIKIEDLFTSLYGNTVKFIEVENSEYEEIEGVTNSKIWFINTLIQAKNL